MNLYFQSILGGVFLLYMAHSMWSMAQLFTNINCSNFPCFESYLNNNPKLQLALFTSVTSNPLLNDVKKVASIKNFNYNEPYEKDLEIDIPLKTRRNGTLFLHVVVAMEGQPLEWKSLQRDGPTVIHKLRLTEYAIPQAATFNLLGDTKTEDDTINLKKSNQIIHPVTHFQSKASVVMLTDLFSMSQQDIPPELARLVRVNRNNEFLPIVQTDFFRTRLKDLNEITKNSTEMLLNFGYNPIGIGKMRLMLQIQHATTNMQQLGFSKKDIDEVKGIFSDTNVYLLCGTVFVGSIHILFDFLSFKNDILFWKRKRNYAGLSMRTTIWRAFSQIVIFLYLLDENTSMLVLIPAGIGAIIELWKCKKILKIELTYSGFHKIKEDESTQIIKDEKVTQEFDREAMRYLSYLLYPLCFCGAVYSLIYQPHKSWYSWTLNSLVNGVYAFGFLFMLPQLFVNYKLKSVAALPWRAFMYKAFNTFIDDIFAFIITMPTAHRVACFRDDVVFIIYLYQRWLYPVDKSRLDSGGAFEIEGEAANTKLTDMNNDKINENIDEKKSINDKKTQ